MLRSNSKGIQPIIPGVSNIQGVNVPLVTFDSLIDTDFGLMLYIDRNFLDPTCFEINFFNSHHTIKSMLQALVNRDGWNPLYICMNKENLQAPNEIADGIYDEFMESEKRYEQILKLSMYTNLCDFIKLAEASGREVRPTIVCRTELEKKFIKDNVTQSTPVIIYDDIKQPEYQQFFFKHIKDPYAIKEGILDIIGEDKSVYLASYKFNDITNPEVAKNSMFLKAVTLNFNRIRIYNLYDQEILKEGE